MPRSFLIKKNNYSNCPLKKRPVTLYKEPQEDECKDVSDDNSEPENLSTKPEDLSVSASQHHYPHKTITPPPGVALISAKRTPLSERPDAVTSQPTSGALHHVPLTSPHHHPHYVGKTSGGPLEPLNLNTPADHHYASSPTSWHRTVAPHYPPPYLTFNYPYPPAAEMYQHHQYPPSMYPVSPVSPYAPRDSSNSPPHHLFSTSTLRAPVSVVASLPHRQQSAAELPKLYMPYQSVDHCGLSPTSSVASSASNVAFQSLSPPPATPEDLSSPGSVSSGSSSAGSTGGGKKRKETGTLPRYQCPDCAKSYSTYSGLTKHQQFHCAAAAGAQAKKSFSCKFCEKVYVSLGALKMHIRTHTLPCKCKLCGKAFSRPWLLQGHIRTHTGEKPFTCPHCNRAFADRSNLRAHLQTHSDVKKYSCSTCSKTFSRMSLLTKHVDGGCPGNNGVIPQFVIQRDSSSGDEAKLYQ